MTLRPGDYMRSSRGWVRCTGIDERGTPVGVEEAPADDAGLDGAGQFVPVPLERAVMIGGFLLALPDGISPLTPEQLRCVGESRPGFGVSFRQ